MTTPPGQPPGPPGPPDQPFSQGDDPSQGPPREPVDPYAYDPDGRSAHPADDRPAFPVGDREDTSAYPPAPPTGSGLGQRRGLGILAGILAPFLLPIAGGTIASVVAEATDRTFMGNAPFGMLIVGQALPLLLGIVLIFFRGWRRFTAGYWIGLSIVLIVIAGACAALIAALVNSTP